MMLGLGWEGFGFGLRWGEGGGCSVVGICASVGLPCVPLWHPQRRGSQILVGGSVKHCVWLRRVRWGWRCKWGMHYPHLTWGDHGVCVWR